SLTAALAARLIGLTIIDHWIACPMRLRVPTTTGIGKSSEPCDGDRLGFSLRGGVWVRLPDIRAALSARWYQRQGSVSIEGTDEFARRTQAAGALVLRVSSAQTKPLLCVAIGAAWGRYTWADLLGRSLHAHSAARTRPRRHRT